jgi:hypothetical protein
VPGEWELAPGTSFAVSSQMEILRANSGSEPPRGPLPATF